ncbi:MAG: hypothetical protein EAZ55_05290 [Cytophagales bacterium]|nr:MAG: hypothetical protein EAZ55_05290 [Cytophagales bacterium]
MYNYLIITVFLLINFAYPLSAQQNLFNIPSGDITKKGKSFYQHQINAYNLHTYESKSHWVYGLGKGWDAGINFVNTKLNFDTPENKGEWFKIEDRPTNAAIKPLVMLTLQKSFHWAKHWAFNIGTQVGTNPFNETNNWHLAHFTYALVLYELKHIAKITAGTYLTNDAFVGAGNDWGFMLGYDIELSKKWHLMGDYLSGSNPNSFATIGGIYDITEQFQLCVGALIPNYENKQSSMGMVIEINLLPR